MEPNQRDHLADTLLEEITLKIDALGKALHAQGVTGNGQRHAPQGQTLTAEQNALLTERDLWEKAHKGLSEARTAMAQAEKYEHQRGAS
jgi:hypothetical protein